MSQTCKHCGSRYAAREGQGEFCCAGCAQVYQLIQGGGLGEYYRQQDRVGQPVGDRAFAHPDHVSIKKLQVQAESGAAAELVLPLKGMSCLGCVWLVEQLSRRQPGVLFARVSLETGHLSLKWQPGVFDLCALADDLQAFGYQITAEAASAAYAPSPLAMRFWLSLVFSVNGLVLTLAAAADIGGVGLGPLYKLLVVLCLLFSLFIGGGIFLKTAFGALRLHRVHRDLLPALVLLASLIWTICSMLFSAAWNWPASLYFILLPATVFVPWFKQIRYARTL
ncbi:MAG: heavy metal translocating P-type ATPase metal-binding domain-containing protein [Opitutales bacterium]